MRYLALKAGPMRYRISGVAKRDPGPDELVLIVKNEQDWRPAVTVYRSWIGRLVTDCLGIEVEQ